MINKADWLNFFNENNISEKNQENWYYSGLSITEYKLKGYTLIDKPTQNIKVAEIKDSKFTGNINTISISGAEVIQKESELDKSLSGKIIDVDGPGILPILTGGGKTTKLVRCLLTCIFPRKHVILITPNEELAADAKYHHNTWLQYTNGISYKCVIHGKEGELLYTIKNEKLIDKENTIIIFDEAHFPNTSYQVVQPLVIRMGYNVLLMSATFPKKNFSISTSKPREVYSITKFANQTNWENEKTQIFFRTTETEYSRKTTGEEDVNAEPLLKSGLDPKKFKLLEDSDIPFVIFDSTNSSAVTGITEGMPPGSLFIANVNHKMGFSPAIDNVILTGETQLKKLEKGSDAGRWIYDKPVTQFLSVASMIQQIGHVGHLTSGKAFLTTQRLKELKPPKDIIYHIISGIMLPKREKPMEELNQKGYPFIASTTDHEYQNLLWASIALPYKKNRPVESVMIGMIGDPKGTVSSRVICPTYNNLPNPNVKDPNLWALHIDGKLPPPELNLENIKIIQLIIIETKLKAINLFNKTKIYIESKNSLIEKVWDLPSKKSDTIPTEKKDTIIKEIKSVVKKIMMEKINIKKTKYKINEKKDFTNTVNWFNFFDEMNIDILRSTIDNEIQKDYSIIITDTEIDKTMKKTIQNDQKNYIKNYLDKDGFPTMFRCENCNGIVKQLFTVILENFHKNNFCELCIINFEDNKIITYIPDRSKLIDNNYYDTLIKNEKDKLNSKYDTLQKLRNNQLKYLDIYDAIILSIQNECVLEILQNKNFIKNQINNHIYPKKLIKLLINTQKIRITESKDIINNTKKLILREKISLNLKDYKKIFNIIDNEKCFSENTKNNLYKLRNTRLKYILEFKNIKNDIENISDTYEYNRFDKKKIKSYLHNDLKKELNNLLLNKKKFIDIYNEIKNINNWNDELINKLENYYKSILNQLAFNNDKTTLENLINDTIQKTLLFLQYKKNIKDETKIENLVKNNRNTIIYNIRNDPNLYQSQKNTLINNIISEKINNSMDILYEELSILIDKKTFFSSYKTNIVNLMLDKLNQKYLKKYDINTIFKKFLTEELNDAIDDYISKVNNLDSRNIRNLESRKNWKKLILDNKSLISNYDKYKEYLVYKLDINNILLNYSENFINNKGVINAKEKATKKLIKYNEKFYEDILERMNNKKNDIEKFKNSGFFDNEIKIKE
ncbi:4386_t:CDS:2, partial [Cetraspora pellucida]